MPTPAEHYRSAQQLGADAGLILRRDNFGCWPNDVERARALIALAQVHATLATVSTATYLEASDLR